MNESASSLRRLDEDAVRIVPVEREVEWARVRNPSDTGLFLRVEIVHNSVILASEGDFFAQDASGTCFFRTARAAHGSFTLDSDALLP